MIPVRHVHASPGLYLLFWMIVLALAATAIVLIFGSTASGVAGILGW